MYIFLDESGDLGFKMNSSKYFVITLLVCYNPQSLLSIKSAVKHTLSRKLNNKKHRKRNIKELKSTATTLQIKKYFLKNIYLKPHQDWSLYSIILNKKALFKRQKNLTDKNRIYNILSHKILEKINFEITGKNILLIVDKCKARKGREIFDHYLKINLESKLPIDTTLDIKHEDSERIEGLQAVDLFCAGIARKYIVNDKLWYKLFAKKIVVEFLYNP
jgi:hypothetical protein